MKLFFLEGPSPFTKTVERLPDGTFRKEPYPHFMRVTSHEEEVDTIEGFYKALTTHAAAGHALLKGQLTRPIVDESRRSLTPPTIPTSWMALDIDGLDCFDDVSAVMEYLELHDVDHIIQYSSSHGLSKKVSAHVFLLLEKDVAPDLLKHWTMQANLNSPVFTEEMHLYKSKVAHSWPLDISICQNDKLIYITPPVFKGMDDPLAARFSLQKRKNRKWAVSTDLEPMVNLRRKSRDVVTRLRAAEGLAATKFSTRTLADGSEIALNVDPAQAEIKDCGEFWRLNLNGGDSWGYWITKNEPRIVRNFKGEPNYYTERLLPDLFPRLLDAAGAFHTAEAEKKGFVEEVINVSGNIHLFKYDLETDTFELTRVSNNTVWKHFLIERGVNVQNYIIREWTFDYEPHNDTLIDVKGRFVNTFRPTEYMKTAPRDDLQVPEVIRTVIHHVIGEELYPHFINWCAYIFQKRTKTGSAWILHGTQGTGKGVIFHKILAPLLGRSAIQVSQNTFQSRFNDFLDEKLLVCVDEADFSTEDSLLRDIMNKITEKTIAVERKFSPVKIVPNRCNFIVNSNRLNPVQLAVADRRFNVGHRQLDPLSKVLDLARLAEIDDELGQFAAFLAGYEVDERAAATPIQTAAKNDMQTLSQTTLDEVVHMLSIGNMEYFVDQYVDPLTVHNRSRSELANEYATLLAAILDSRKKECNLSRDAIRTIVHHCVGQIEQGEGKFTRMLAHHGLKLEKKRPFNQHGVTRPCVSVMWEWNLAEWAEWQDILSGKHNTVALRAVK